MTKKQIGRCIAFLLVAGLMLVLLCDLFELQNTTNSDKRFTTYRTFAEDSIDAVWIGTSGADRYWIAAKAYEEYGMTVYPLAADAMPTWLFVNIIEETYTYQNPELIIIDARAFGQDNISESTMDVCARRVLDAMDFFSVNRLKTAFKAMEVMHSAFEDQPRWNLSYLLPFIKYHTKWAEDDYTVDANLGNKEHAYGGFFMNSSLSVQAQAQDTQVYDSDYVEDLDPVTEAALYELLAYVAENDINVLFVDTPQFKSEKEIGRANRLYQILDEHGITYINYCDTDADGSFLYGLNLDAETDFYNDNHTNYYGAEKFTDVFAAYLNEHYDLPDRRENISVQEDWDGVYVKIKNRVARWAK